ncbi:MAG: hypothetical protein JWR79_473 [Tardiphaga sp.]|nr:hypothetical protein [Tardiphaga sp.]
MNWFRRHIRTGSRLALFALAIQFVLAFGHTHQHGQIATGTSADAVTVEYGTASLVPAERHDRPQHPSLGSDCAICAGLAMTASALFGSPPILPAPEAFNSIYRAADAGLAHLGPSHAAFQPRGPPTS